jgi:hypothetical protein
MRRVVVWLPLLVTAVGALAAAAWALAPAASAAPAQAPAQAQPVAGKALCTITDTRLTELSGMVATRTGFVVANDSTDLDSHRRIFVLDARCAVTDTISYPSRPLDPEDLAQAKDGTIWIADIGDNAGSEQRRPNVALWRLPAGAERPALFRMKYPDGAHDAEALLISGDGTPVIVTKELGKAGVYTPAAPLRQGQTVALQKAGEFTPPKTTTSNPLAAAGRLTVTGGANSPDGSRVVLRTYADAYEFDVTNGDVVEAITKGTARITPLPDEPRGEAITYSADGKSFLTVSETAGQPGDTKPRILQYAPATAAASEQTRNTAAAGSSADSRSWVDKLTLTDITYLVGAVGVLGLLLVVVGVFGIRRARRRPPDEGAFGGVSPTGPVPMQARAAPISPPVPSYGYEPPAWDRQPPAGSRGTEYRSGGRPPPGSTGAAGSAGRGGVYGAPAGGGGSSGGRVYGGGGSYRPGAGDQYDAGYDYADPDPRY